MTKQCSNCQKSGETCIYIPAAVPVRYSSVQGVSYNNKHQMSGLTGYSIYNQAPADYRSVQDPNATIPHLSRFSPSSTVQSVNPPAAASILLNNGRQSTYPKSFSVWLPHPPPRRSTDGIDRDMLKRLDYSWQV